MTDEDHGTKRIVGTVKVTDQATLIALQNVSSWLPASSDMFGMKQDELLISGDLCLALYISEQRNWTL